MLWRPGGKLRIDLGFLAQYLLTHMGNVSGNLSSSDSFDWSLHLILKIKLSAAFRKLKPFSHRSSITKGPHVI